MNIAFCYNVKHNTERSIDISQEDLEFDSIEVIEGIENVIKSLGHNVIKIEADNDAFEKLRKFSYPESNPKIDLVFNIAEGLKGDARESQIPLFCEMLGLPYTHSSPTTHALKLNKHLTKAILSAEGIDCPKSEVVNIKSIENITLDTLLEKMNFPLIVKPNKQGSSKGIFNDSVVKSKEALRNTIKKVLESYDEEAIIEEYIDGREFTVALLGNPPKVLPIIEQKFDCLPKGFNKIAGYELKWIYEDALPNPFDSVSCPADISKELQEEIERVSKKIWLALDVRDCARIDYRYANNKLYFIEINTLPGINPDEKIVNYFPLAARKAGLSFTDMINEIIQSALKRYIKTNSLKVLS